VPDIRGKGKRAFHQFFDTIFQNNALQQTLARFLPENERACSGRSRP